MSDLPTTFDELMAPLGADAFYADYYGKTPVHIAGGAARFTDLMSWDRLNHVLELHTLWTGRMLQMALDREQIAPERYCAPAATVHGEQLMADPGRVQAFLAEGASLVVNSMESLTPELNQIAGILEDEFLGTAQGNLYCSRTARQAFDTHYDTHDVFALHTTGEKVWRIYDARLKTPMTHPAIDPPGPEMADRAREKLLMEVTMRPGDVLYIPRGQYHDALASSDACIHIAFGMVPMRGNELFAELENIAVADGFFRADLPGAHAGEAGFAAYMHEFAEKLSAMAADPEVLDRLRLKQAQRRRARGAYKIEAPAKSSAYRRKTAGLRLTEQKGQLLLTDGKQGAPIPPGTGNFIRWVLERPEFLEVEAVAAFPHWETEKTRRTLLQLCQMQVIEKAQ